MAPSTPTASVLTSADGLGPPQHTNGLNGLNGLNSRRHTNGLSLAIAPMAKVPDIAILLISHMMASGAPSFRAAWS